MFNAKEVCQKLNDFDQKFCKLTERFGLSGQNCSALVINASNLRILILPKRAGG